MALPLPHLLRVAKNQRGIMICILASTAVAGMNAFTRPPPLAAAIASLVVMTVSMLFTIRLARLLYDTAATVVCAVLLLAPTVAILLAPQLLVIMWFVALITLLVVNGRATKEIKAGGFRVGLLGGDPAEIEKRMRGA